MPVNLHFKVCIRCMTYNHVNYIKQALNGFCIQKTGFPFICTIVDDYSSDGEREVIESFLQENLYISNHSRPFRDETDDYISVFAQHKINTNCYFVVYFLKYNHHGKKSKLPYTADWENQAEYTAYCEGDDYWTDPQKLDRQVSFLESHPDYSMVCNKTKKYSQRLQRITGTDFDIFEDTDLSVRNIIINGGLYISTCSILFRHEARFHNGIYPSYCLQCHVGDYPLQIMLALNGKVRCLSRCMSVYRVDNPDSWVGRINSEKQLTKVKLNGFISEIRMLQGFSYDFPHYSIIFNERIRYYIILNMPYRENDPKGYNLFNKALRKEMKLFTSKDRLLLKITHYGGLLNSLYNHYKRIKHHLS